MLMKAISINFSVFKFKLRLKNQIVFDLFLVRCWWFDIIIIFINDVVFKCSKTYIYTTLGFKSIIKGSLCRWFFYGLLFITKAIQKINFFLFNYKSVIEREIKLVAVFVQRGFFHFFEHVLNINSSSMQVTMCISFEVVCYFLNCMYKNSINNRVTYMFLFLYKFHKYKSKFFFTLKGVHTNTRQARPVKVQNVSNKVKSMLYGSSMSSVTNGYVDNYGIDAVLRRGQARYMLDSIEARYGFANTNVQQIHQNINGIQDQGFGHGLIVEPASSSSGSAAPIDYIYLQPQEPISITYVSSALRRLDSMDISRRFTVPQEGILDSVQQESRQLTTDHISGGLENLDVTRGEQGIPASNNGNIADSFLNKYGLDAVLRWGHERDMIANIEERYGLVNANVQQINNNVAVPQAQVQYQSMLGEPATSSSMRPFFDDSYLYIGDSLSVYRVRHVMRRLIDVDRLTEIANNLTSTGEAIANPIEHINNDLGNLGSSLGESALDIVNSGLTTNGILGFSFFMLGIAYPLYELVSFFVVSE